MNKYLYLHVVQGLYSLDYGWEDLCEYEDRSGATHDLAEYRLACPNAQHRIIQRREPNPDYTEREV